jgi:hypothetical protein
MAQVPKNADTWLGGNAGTGLYIDETAFTEKGKKSVGLAGNGMVVWVKSITAE